MPLLAAGALAGCVSDGGAPPPLPPLAADSSRPLLALFEHVLTGYFAEAGAQGPTVCATLSPKPLSAEQEEALILRFVRLAPADRCRPADDGTWRDAITGEPAQTVRIYNFACREEAPCAGWATVPGRPATRYTLRFEGGAWRFDGDPRIIAE
ncbi:MAG: hypothetical protein BGO08_08440 [Altererythrobacter sp. 66-12]|nr:MAG: hypothetical protein BGO08_08440 [Altererythrobacter sp. 66-12]